MTSSIPSFIQASPALRLTPADCDIRLQLSPNGRELFLTAVPGQGDPILQAQTLYQRLADILRLHQALVITERLFASPSLHPSLLQTRARCLGARADQATPTLLSTSSLDIPLVGIQVHAVIGIAPPAILHLANNALARSFTADGYHYLTATGIQSAALPTAPAQARAVFATAAQLLTQAGGQLWDIARTWIWMDDILSWYNDLNQVRNQYFQEQGMFAVPDRMPASTGIGVSPRSARVALDFFAVWGRDDAVSRFHAAGKQRSAFEYGSAFARASRAKTPGGHLVFCSGTAAIDTTGKTCFVDDIPGQVQMTLDNVQAVLRDMQCSSSDVVQAMAYCANPAVAQHFLAHHHPALPWPCLTMQGIVCRPDLLFEVEVTACPGARSC